MSRTRLLFRSMSARVLSRPLSVCQRAAPCGCRAEAKHWTQSGLRAGEVNLGYRATARGSEIHFDTGLKNVEIAAWLPVSNTPEAVIEAPLQVRV